ncbi:hypothetical protein [Clavibacter capsici]|uniref:hypothetical protein n=1 Tax=Clavibacter capsici TaxID=1874630 RepID=UPI001428139B|nr:hypothetical protein [Clavibacter capsici]QIS40488.1 hypothetical protein GW572_14960 [Clavibacter capsici]
MMLVARSVPGSGSEDTGVFAADATSTATPEPEDRALAFAAATAFCRPDVDSGTWQRALDPDLTADARVLYAATDPANVPCAGVMDAGGPVGDQQTATDAAWQFDAAVGGPVTVTLHRDRPAAPWKVSYIDPAGGAP